MLYRVPYGSEVGPRIGKTEGKGGRQAGGSMREAPGRWLRRTTSKEAREKMKISSDMVPISMCRARRTMSGPLCSKWTSHTCAVRVAGQPRSQSPGASSDLAPQP